MTFCFKLFITIVIASQMTFTFAEMQTPLDLTVPVQKIKQQLPQELTEDILLTDVTYDRNKQLLSYSATVLKTTPEEIDQNFLIDKVCYTPKLRNVVKENIAVSFSFFDERKNPLKQTTITEDVCQKNFTELEKKLTENLKQSNKTLLPLPISPQLIIFKMGYQPAEKAIAVDIKAANDNVDSTVFNQAQSIKIACTNNYLSLFTLRDLNFIFNYYNTKGDQRLKTINVSSRDCQPKEANDTNTLLDKKLTADAQAMKQNLKALSTNQIELFDVEYNKQKRIISLLSIIKEPSMTKDKINPQAMIMSLCKKQATREVIDQGVAYHYRYYNTDKELLVDFLIDNAVCQRYDNETNLLLQKK